MRGWISQPSYQQLAAGIAKARIASGLSQRELARRVSMAPSLIAKIETGQRRLDVMEFVAISKALGRPAPELLSELMGQLGL